jgi:hypothetical protein
MTISFNCCKQKQSQHTTTRKQSYTPTTKQKRSPTIIEQHWQKAKILLVQLMTGISMVFLELVLVVK